MARKTLQIEFYCPKCGADVQESLINKEESNKNWNVCLKKCPFCGDKIEIRIIK